MLTEVGIDIIPFLTVFFLYVLIFTFITIVLGADFAKDDYNFLPTPVRILFAIFRMSIGDLAVYHYGKWSNDDGEIKN
jgi:hypothetical protein